MNAPLPVAVIERALPDPTHNAQVDQGVRDLLSGSDPGPVGERLVILHFHGRNTRRQFDLPAGLHRLDGGLYVATGAGWRHNFTTGSPAEVTWRGLRRPAYLQSVGSPEETAHGYRELAVRYGVSDAQRRLGIVINVNRIPTLEEVREAVHRCGLTLIEVRFEQGVTA